MASVVEIDGSVLEGGGQILRVSAALSVLMKTPIRITKIRAGRPKPGLRPQHLKGLEVVQTLCNGQLKGGVPDSTEVTFLPGVPRGGNYEADTQTAGSITLLIQVSLPCALFANTTTIMKFRGGTNTDMAPQLDYMTEVFRPTLERFGASFDYKLLKRGYYPRGGGVVHIRVQPVHRLEPVTLLERGTIQRVWGWAFVAGNIPIKVANTMADAATRELQSAFGIIEVNIEAYKENPENAVGTCSGINIVAQTSTGILLGASALGKRELQPAQTGLQVANQLIETANSGACVDDHCQDQIILFMALAKGISEVKAKFSIVNAGPNSNIIHCVGIGLQNHNIP
ncbi:RNA 3'-terminal phosphate cyclase [Gryllus bimaculatus]|nr:RNA 3'-terminal phosphate cyclase [Gryllus bimaculatus]